MSDDGYITIQVQVPAHLADWGCSDSEGDERSYAITRVFPDGSVQAHAPGTEAMSPWHQLPEQYCDEARRLAALVRAGTHYSAGGFVRPVKRGAD